MKLSTLIIISTVLWIGIDATSIEKRSPGKSRAKRFLWEGVWFPYNTCIALAIVLAIPLELKNRNVYMSYNFETNFYLPYFDVTQGLVPLPFATVEFAASFFEWTQMIIEPGVIDGTKIVGADAIITRNLDGDAETITENNENSESLERSMGNATETETQLRYISIETTTNNYGEPETMMISNTTQSTTAKTRTTALAQSEQKTKKTKGKKKKNKRVNREILSTLLSRKKFYRMLEHKLNMAGFDGRECLMKAICETTQHPFEEHNGVLGDIVHILFTPQTSRDENLAESYYQAVRDGELGLCASYNSRCPNGIFDFITQFA